MDKYTLHIYTLKIELERLIKPAKHIKNVMGKKILIAIITKTVDALRIDLAKKAQEAM